MSWRKNKKRKKGMNHCIGLWLKEFGSNDEDKFNWAYLASQKADVASFSCMEELNNVLWAE